MPALYGDTTMSISTSNIHETSMSIDPETLTPRSLKKKAPKSLPDTSRTVVKKKSRMSNDIDVENNDDDGDRNANWNNSISDFFYSPSKWTEKIDENPDEAILHANDIMKCIVERNIVLRVKQVSLIDAETKLMSLFETAWRNKMAPAVIACVERLSFCDVSFLQSKCPNPIPVCVLVSIYELKLRNSGRPGNYHATSCDEEKRWCEECGEVTMITCENCNKFGPKKYWCSKATCIERYQSMGEIVCSVTKYCDQCQLPIQTDMYVRLKSGHCQCTGPCCFRFFIDESSAILYS